MNEEYKGIIPRACEHIFSHIENDKNGTEYLLKCSFIEIYKENIHDLLDNNFVSNLKVHETPLKGVWIQGLSEHYVSTVNEIIAFLKSGERHRAVSSTRMNSNSSRSHSLFTLTLTQKFQDGSSKEGKLNLVDLAGSEKVGKTGASGETLEEAKKINQSLSALGNCINALTKSKRGHVPYRDSKLTHILRESLGGNSKTTLLIACSPHIYNIEETISTLKFGQRAKSIKNSVHVNQQRSVKELEAIIKNLDFESKKLLEYINQMKKSVLKFDPNYVFKSFLKFSSNQNTTKNLDLSDSSSNNQGSFFNSDNDDINFSDNDKFMTPKILENQEFSTNFKELNETQSEINTFEIDYQLNLIKLKEVISQISNLNQSKEEEILQKQAEHLENQKKIQHLENEISKNRERSTNQLLYLEEKFKSPQSVINSLENDNKDLENQIILIKTENEQLNLQLNSLKDKYLILKDQFSSEKAYFLKLKSFEDEKIKIKNYELECKEIESQLLLESKESLKFKSIKDIEKIKILQSSLKEAKQSLEETIKEKIILEEKNQEILQQLSVKDSLLANSRILL